MNSAVCLGLFLYLFSFILTTHTTAQEYNFGGVKILETEYFDITQLPSHHEVVVAVIDSEFNLEHDALVGQVWVNPNEIADNGIDDDGNGYIDDISGWDFDDNDNTPHDEGSHGTQVTSLIVGNHEEPLNLGGLAREAKFIPIRYGSSRDYEDAVRLAISYGVDVINMSFRSPAIYGIRGEEGFESACDLAKEAGIILIAGAGNDSFSLDTHTIYPASFDSVISVAGHDVNFDRYTKTNYGSNVEFGSYATAVWVPSQWSNSGYLGASGTSFASPIIAGVAAKLKGYDNSYTQDDFESLLSAHSEPYDGLTLQYGRVKADELSSVFLEKTIRYIEAVYESGESVLLEFHIFTDRSSNEVVSIILKYYYTNGIRYSVFQEVSI